MHARLYVLPCRSRPGPALPPPPPPARPRSKRGQEGGGCGSLIKRPNKAVPQMSSPPLVVAGLVALSVGGHARGNQSGEGFEEAGGA